MQIKFQGRGKLIFSEGFFYGPDIKPVQAKRESHGNVQVKIGLAGIWTDVLGPNRFELGSRCCMAVLKKINDSKK